MGNLEPRNRLLIAALITLFIAGAIFASFGGSLFSSSSPHVLLPETDSGAGDSALELPVSQPAQRVEVTPQTVQSVIASLERASSYYQELSVETFWSGGSYSCAVMAWVDGGWSHSKQTTPSGLVRHDLVGEGQIWYWYEGSESWRSAPADGRSADLARHLPTYETVLALDPSSILETGYEIHADVPCVFVRSAGALEGYEECYWVSVDSGLLVSAQTLEKGELVSRVTAAGAVISPCPRGEGIFTLPDGTVLHRL